jgi:enoyl-CoA hydratase/carnithine racemase
VVQESGASAPIRLERDGAVAHMVLSNPPLNLWGRTAFESFSACLSEVEVSDARALVWRAEGDLFTAGVDVHLFEGNDPKRAAEMFAALIAAVRRLEALPIPTLALAHGLCLTIGLEISLGCDMLWASESARFGLVEAVVGLTPGAGGTQRMAERAGPARAREFVMSGGIYDAATLERWGVVNRVLPDAELHEEGLAFARKLAAGPTRAHAASKRIVRAQLEGGVDRADRETPKVGGELFGTEDLRRAVRSFLEEGPGKAMFEGR